MDHLEALTEVSDAIGTVERLLQALDAGENVGEVMLDGDRFPAKHLSLAFIAVGAYTTAHAPRDIKVSFLEMALRELTAGLEYGTKMLADELGNAAMNVPPIVL